MTRYDIRWETWGQVYDFWIQSARFGRHWSLRYYKATDKSLHIYCNKDEREHPLPLNWELV